MAAVAMIDLCTLSYSIQRELITFYQSAYLCYSKTTDYNLIMMRMITDYARNFSRRCSTWLSLSITIIRALTVRYPMSVGVKKLSSPKAAYIIISGILFTIIPLNFLEVFRYDVVLVNEDFECGNDEYNYRYYFYDISELFYDNYDVLETWYKRIDGITSKMIPCTLFPLSTVVLIREMRRTDKSHQKMASKSNSHANTSHLVLAQTLTFFIAEIPLGIVFLLQSMNDDAHYGRASFLVLFEIFFSFVLSVTTASHMIICVLMSSQYRMNALMIIRCGYPYKVNIV